MKHILTLALACTLAACAAEVPAYRWHRTGETLTDADLEAIKGHDAILLGAVGFPGVPDHVSLRDLLLRIRHDFDEYVNVRPVRLLKGAPCPLKGVEPGQIDMTFIRENSEGEYAGSGSWLYAGTPREIVIQDGVFSRHGTERIMRYAFELARREHRSLTSISKGNALNYSMVFWDQVFEELSAEYPEVETHSYLVDAAAMLMVRDPGRFQVVVASNLFGDILTDLGAAISGGMGLAAGANLNPEGRFPSMFEPIHGSAPDIVGRGIANPLATLWSASQMLEHLGHAEWARRVLDAIERVLQDGDTLTPDLGGSASTSELGERVVRELLPV